MKFFESPMGKILREYEHEKSINPVVPNPHKLSKPLLISLTSYPARFKWLHLTLKSLVEQETQPDRIILWIARDDVADLPPTVTALSDTIEIAKCDDLRSYKKIVPTLENHPGCYVVTCDDDTYYPRDWLKQLVTLASNDKVCLCHSAHRFHCEADGTIARYRDWTLDVQDQKSRSRSPDTLAVGVGGVLYPPDSLGHETTNRKLFNELCPSSDDLWLYVMARRNGYLSQKVGKRLQPIFWPETQENGLWQKNMYTNDDIAISRLIQHFGRHIFDPDDSL